MSWTVFSLWSGLIGCLRIPGRTDFAVAPRHLMHTSLSWGGQWKLTDDWAGEIMHVYIAATDSKAFLVMMEGWGEGGVLCMNEHTACDKPYIATMS